MIGLLQKTIFLLCVSTNCLVQSLPLPQRSDDCVEESASRENDEKFVPLEFKEGDLVPRIMTDRFENSIGWVQVRDWYDEQVLKYDWIAKETVEPYTKFKLPMHSGVGSPVIGAAIPRSLVNGYHIQSLPDSRVTDSTLMVIDPVIVHIEVLERFKALPKPDRTLLQQMRASASYIVQKRAQVQRAIAQSYQIRYENMLSTVRSRADEIHQSAWSSLKQSAWSAYLGAMGVFPDQNVLIWRSTRMPHDTRVLSAYSYLGWITHAKMSIRISELDNIEAAVNFLKMEDNYLHKNVADQYLQWVEQLQLALDAALMAENGVGKKSVLQYLRERFN